MSSENTNEEVVTLDGIEQFIWQATGFKGDAAQMDAIRVMIQAWALQASPLWKKVPAEVLEAQLSTLCSLASQLLDTGGRMRLDPRGQLDVPEDPVATKADVNELSRKLITLHGTLQSMAKTERRDAFAAVNERLEVIAAQVESLVLRHEALASTILAAGPYAPPSPELAAWERDMLTSGQVELGPEPVLGEADLEAITTVWPESANDRSKFGRPQPVKPGCFYNEDGTITCRVCGEAKDPALYYKDKQSRTGRKSLCKDCEQAGKTKAAA